MAEFTPDSDTVQISFAGCGGLYHYELGVAAVIQEHFDTSNTVVIGSSAGSFPGLLLALDYSVPELFECWNIPFIADTRTHLTMSCFNWNGLIRKWTPPNIKEGAYKKIQNRFYTALTSWPNFPSTAGMANVLKSNWRSNEDLLDGCMASAFIPCYSYFTASAQFRGQRYVDGSLTGPEDSIHRPLGEHNPVLLINPPKWREIKPAWMWTWLEEDWVRQLYRWGKEDGEKNIAEIAAVLPWKPGSRLAPN